MEEELKRWNEEVSQTRKRFYELNYYTTHQLLVLRSELGKMKNLGQAKLPQQAQVMALLQSISPHISPAVVMNVVQQIAMPFPGAREESGMQKLPIPQNTHVPSTKLELPLLSVSPIPIVQRDDVLLRTVSQSGSMLQVSLSQGKLNEEQREHFTYVRNKYGWRESIVLRAIEEFGRGDRYDLENWLKHNVHRIEEMSQNHDQEDESEDEVEQDEESDSGSQKQKHGLESQSEICTLYKFK